MSSERGFAASESPAPVLPLCLDPALLLGVGARLAPAGLLGERALAQVSALRGRLPPVACVGAFEVRLEREDGPLDFEVCLRATAGTRDRLGAWLQGRAAADLSAASAGGSRVVRFLSAWIDPLTGLFEAIPVLWLEMDAASPGAELDPFVVLTLDRDRFHPDGVGDRKLLTRFLSSTLALAGDGLDADVQATLRHVLASLPPAAELAHAAVRPGPLGDVVRLVVRLPGSSLPETLRELGWSGCPGALRRLLDVLFTTRAVHPVNLDLGAGLGPRVGIEFHHPTSPREDERWTRFFDALEAEGACSRTQRSRVSAWPTPRTEEPRLVEVERDLLVKVVYALDAPLTAKAYLPFGVQLRGSRVAVPRPRQAAHERAEAS